jgi:hypothetical protein
LSWRPFDEAQDKLRPASILVCAVRLKKNWIPAYAGMTKRKKNRLLVDEFRTPRLIAEGCLSVLGMLADWEGESPFANRMEVKAHTYAASERASE